MMMITVIKFQPNHNDTKISNLSREREIKKEIQRVLRVFALLSLKRGILHIFITVETLFHEMRKKMFIVNEIISN